MPVLENYHHFGGQHWETGTIHNTLAYQGVVTAHTGQPISEALLLGISGGITFGYFTFEYKGYAPHIALLTRNTFDPMPTIFDRLVIPQDVLQTTNPAKAEANLVAVLEAGNPAIVWADTFSLPYNLLPPDARQWAMMPIVVYGIQDGKVYIADRSRQPLIISAENLMQARSRTKDIKFRIVSLDIPDMDRLPSAVQKGIWQCISLFTETPPKGAKDNFGFAALQHWANMLVNTRNKRSWERFFPRGSYMYGALAGNATQPGAFDWISTWGAGAGAERGLYADFLDEAALILNRPSLKAVANQFRTAHEAWHAMADALLPDEVPLFKETRELKLRKHALFLTQGMKAIDEMQAINRHLDEIRAAVADQFPLDVEGVTAMRERLRDHVLKIHDIEYDAIMALQAAMA